MLILSRKVIITLLIIVVADSSSGIKIADEADTKFVGFLTQQMVDYGKWIKEIENDPSKPLPEKITLTADDFYRISLTCELSNQAVEGHSIGTGDVPLVEGSFSNHYALIGRQVHQLYKFTGKYNCTGIVRAGSVNKNDLFFSGAGNFIVNIESSEEFVEVVNLGVTQDYKFDLTNSWSGYVYRPIIKNVEFDAEWNSTEMAGYALDVQSTFEMLYNEHLSRERRPLAHINPSRVILQRYINEILRNVDLTDIIEKDNLPPPYEATPTPSTAPPSTTTSRPREYYLTAFLDKKMAEYGKWIQDIKQDPSAQLPDTIALASNDLSASVYCDVSRQIIRHHSNTTNDIEIVDSSFKSHYVIIGRDIRQPHELAGNYSCSGVIYGRFGMGLTDDLYFNGSGNFIVNVTSSDESVEVFNLGVTQDRKFDLSHIWTSYFYNPRVADGGVQFVGEWNDTNVVNYISLIKTAFTTRYRQHLSQNESSVAHLNPSRVLLLRYANEILRNADLTEIIEEYLVPPPYSATPSEPTTTTTSTTTTPKTTAGPSPQPPPSGAASVFIIGSEIGFWKVFSLILLGFLSFNI